VHRVAFRRITRAAGGSDLLDWGGVSHSTLAIVRPQASNLSANDRIYHAYPGLEYNICAAVVGGVGPFKYELTTNVPSGMGIDINTGEITWPSPSAATYSDIGLKVTDSVGTEVTSSWSIVCATTRFVFVDASAADDTGTGAIGSPWKTLGKFQADGTATSIGIFRAGTYNVRAGTGVTISDGNSTRWGTALDRPSIFLAYPGEEGTVIFDHDYEEGVTEGLEFDFVENGPSTYAYMDGIKHQYSRNKGIRLGPTNHNFCFRRCIYTNWGPGWDSHNSAMIDFESGGYGAGTLDRGVIQDCEATGMITTTGTDEGIAFGSHGAPYHGASNCWVKLYATEKLLIERVYFHDITNPANIDDGLISNKAGNVKLIIRSCWSDLDVAVPCYGGNMDDQTTGECDIEMSFCNFYIAGTAQPVVYLAYNGESGLPSYLDRNTFRGRVRYKNLVSTEGPYVWRNNVVINDLAATDDPDGSGCNHELIAHDASRMDWDSTHLFGAAADGITDTNGLLTGSYRTLYLYYRGHEVPTL
jgi:hypothetical protein